MQKLKPTKEHLYKEYILNKKTAKQIGIDFQVLLTNRNDTQLEK